MKIRVIWTKEWRRRRLTSSIYKISRIRMYVSVYRVQSIKFIFLVDFLCGGKRSLGKRKGERSRGAEKLRMQETVVTTQKLGQPQFAAFMLSASYYFVPFHTIFSSIVIIIFPVWIWFLTLSPLRGGFWFSSPNFCQLALRSHSTKWRVKVNWHQNKMDSCMLPKRKSHTVNRAPNNHRNQIIEKKKDEKN